MLMAVQQSAVAAAPLVFDKVTVVDVEQGKLVADQRVVIVGNRIQRVGAVAAVPVPQGARLIDARGKYMIPGLWDMHYHVDDFSQGDDVALQTNLYRATYPLFIAYGVTGIREMAQRFQHGADSFRVWQRAVLAGERVGPRAIGPSVDLEYHELVPQTPEDAARVIDSLKAVGTAFVKFHGQPADTVVFFALLREARRAGLPVDGHLLTWTASDSGQRSIEHVFFRGCYEREPSGDSVFIEPKCAERFAQLARNGTWIVPTMSVLYFEKTPGENPYKRALARAYRRLPPEKKRGESLQDLLMQQVFGSETADDGALSPPDSVRARWGRLGPLPDDRAIGAAQRAGVRILAGTDGGPFLHSSPGFSLQLELRFLVENGGLTPLEALRAATLNPAKFLGATDSLGTVAPGRLADLVLLDADPLTNIRNISAIHAVVANGRYFDRTTLDIQRTQAEQAWPGR